MPVIYNNKKIIPAPLPTIKPTFLKNEQGEIVGTQFDITLMGKMMAWRGSPTSSGTFWTVSGYPADETIAQDSKLTALIAKQKALTNLFSTQGLQLIIQGIDGVNAFVCNPQVNEITFSEGPWIEEFDYNISLTAFSAQGISTTNNVRNTKEEWTIELNETPESDINPQSFRISHNISAQGLLIYNADGSVSQAPWLYAQQWVLPRLGLDSNMLLASGALNVPSYMGGWSQVRSESLDKQAGTFSVTEQWIAASGNCLEDFSVSTQNSIEMGVTRVNITGQLNGLEIRDSNYILSTTKYQSASGRFESIKNNLFQRAQSYSNTSLNPTPLTSDIGRNPLQGTISYNYEFDNRPTNFVSGARSEIITLVNNDPADLIAVFPIPGRAAGPIIQNLGSITEKTRQLTIELVLNKVNLGVTQSDAAQVFANTPRVDPNYSTQIAALIAAARPVANQVFVPTQPQETWIPKGANWTYTITWIYQ